MNPLTIVMYHYVRPLADSPWPRLKGLELADFEGQLDYIERHYQVVSADDVIAAAQGKPLPQSPLLLTFDDGYADHYHYVLPALARRNMTAVFFPPVRAVQEREMLDVNKIHFVLESADNLEEMIAVIEHEVRAARLKPVSEYREKLHRASRFDNADVAYIKRMLQFELPEQLRCQVTSMLFKQYVGMEEKAFADELYMSEGQLKDMLNAGMSVGGHGYAHRWLDKLPVNEQAEDIDESLAWLRSLGACKKHFLFCYPYGGYTKDTVALLKMRNCSAAFTSKVALAEIAPDTMLELPRIDTNDLPKNVSAPAVEWTTQARVGVA